MTRCLALSMLLSMGCGDDTAPAHSDPAPPSASSSADTDLPLTGVWQTLEDGLESRDLVIGEGKRVRDGDGIVAHYSLWLYDDDTKGEQVDSSRGGDPFTATVGVGQLIEGWERGIPGMREGGLRELIVGSELAYGSDGAGDSIPPDATLFFEVEILERL